VRTAGLSVGLGTVLGLLLPAIASGATVEAGDFSGELEITAPAGEANELVLTGSRQDGVTTIDVADSGPVPLVAGEGCEASNAGVRCELESLYIVFAELGDMDDGLDGSGIPDDIQITAGLGPGDDEMTGPPDETCVDAGDGDDEVKLIEPTGACSVDGEEGDDTLLAHSGRNYLYGGSGVDRIVGGHGTDNIDGGEGADRLIAGPGADFIDDGKGEDLARGGAGGDFFADDPGKDVLEGNAGPDAYGMYLGPRDGDDLLDGGKGTDVATFLCRTCRVSLDGRANDGRKGERDNILVENVRIRSSIFDDDAGVIRFGSGRDLIEGDEGRNVLAGYRGKDRIIGNAGKDTLLGGKDDDRLHALDGERDDVDCGKGEDRAIVDAMDEVRNCEEVGILPPFRRRADVR